MTQRITRIAAVLAILLGLVAPLPAAAATNVFKDVCSKSSAQSSAACQKPTTTNPLTGSNGLIINITHIIAVVAGAVAVIVIIISGFKFVLSNGDAAQATAARNSILYALVGLVVIIMASSIISLVMSKV